MGEQVAARSISKETAEAETIKKGTQWCRTTSRKAVPITGLTSDQRT